MKEFRLGNMSEAKALRVKTALDGQTYMNFHISMGIIGGPSMCVTLETDYDASDVEILEFALYVLATS